MLGDKKRPSLAKHPLDLSHPLLLVGGDGIERCRAVEDVMPVNFRDWPAVLRRCCSDDEVAHGGDALPRRAAFPQGEVLTPLRGVKRPFLAGLGELLQDHVALQLRQMIDEQHAFEVIHLVLEADG